MYFDKHKLTVNLALADLLRNLMADYGIGICLYDEDANLIEYDLSYISFGNHFSEYNKLTLIKSNGRTIDLAESENVIFAITCSYQDGDEFYTESITHGELLEYGNPSFW